MQLNLHTTEEYLTALESFLEISQLTQYLESNIIPVPTDFPGQLHIRRLIARKLALKENSSIPNHVLHFTPMLGPLHLSLNSRETTVKKYRTFSTHFLLH